MSRSEKVTAIGFMQKTAPDGFTAEDANVVFASLIDLQAHADLEVVSIGVSADGTLSAIWKERTVDGWMRAVARGAMRLMLGSDDDDD